MILLKERSISYLTSTYILYQMKLKGEIDLVWLNTHNFLEPVEYNKQRSQGSLPRNHNLLKNLRKKSKERGK